MLRHFLFAATARAARPAIPGSPWPATALLAWPATPLPHWPATDCCLAKAHDRHRQCRGRKKPPSAQAHGPPWRGSLPCPRPGTCLSECVQSVAFLGQTRSAGRWVRFWRPGQLRPLHCKPSKEFMCELRKRIIARAHDYDAVAATGQLTRASPQALRSGNANAFRPRRSMSRMMSRLPTLRSTVPPK